jgi:GT2 family glycosyltransferase
MVMSMVSIVLPTFRREALLCEALGDLLRQDWPTYEIIVVDQTPHHTPETQAFLEDVKDRILYLRQERPSVVAAANHGVRASQGEIVLFVDDDIRIPDPDFVRSHVKNYSEPAIGGVAGRVLDAGAFRLGESDPRSPNPASSRLPAGHELAAPREVNDAPGANMSFRREVILRVGGFDEHFVGNAFRFEHDFCLRVRRAGYRVVYDPHPTVHHFYGSAGGNDNRHLLGRDSASHGWYQAFFHNQTYVALKHMPPQRLPVLLWHLYRGHVLNRAFAREGLRFLLARHRAFVGGVTQSWLTYRRGAVQGRIP